MNAHILTQNKEIDGRMFQFEKLPALEGIKLGKMLAAKLLPMVKALAPGDIQEKGNLREVMKNMSPSVLDGIPLDSIADVLDGIGPGDLETITSMSLTRVSEILPANICAVMDRNGFYQVSDVEYDPVLFIRLIWEELKFGLSDFFKGDRWISLFQTEAPADSPLSQPIA